MILLLILVVVILLAAGFYFLVPIKDSPLHGGPIDENNPPQKLKKVSLYEYYKLKKGIFDRTIIE